MKTGNKLDLKLCVAKRMLLAHEKTPLRNKKAKEQKQKLSRRYYQKEKEEKEQNGKLKSCGDRNFPTHRLRSLKPLLRKLSFSVTHVDLHTTV